MRKCHGKDSIRHRRFLKGMARRVRIRTLKNAIGGAKSGIVASMGVVAATAYGAAVNGVSDSELGKVTRIGAAGMSPGAMGRSLTALLALKGDPAWRAAVGPILQWIRIIKILSPCRAT